SGAPRVVAGAAEELELRAVGPEAVEPLAEPEGLASDGPPEARVADDAVDPVVEAVAQIARAGVRIARAPAGEEHRPGVGPVVAVDVLQEHGLGYLVDDQAAPCEDHARGDAQAVGEDGELVGLAVAVGVLEDPDPVVPPPGGLEIVGIIDR